ncbi:helix-turn-helix domain-containing protein [Streptomyces sp. NPDC055990]|uniref:helix-turn-helix domain-containing protein n=1 Tax=Streptomyces sp. NPDC055990 TaxID=3345672 RepID=UPI0035D78369
MSPVPAHRRVACTGRCCLENARTGGQRRAVWENRPCGPRGTKAPPTGRLETGVGQIGQGLERVLRTRPVPSSTEARLRFLLTAHRGSTRRVAAHLGVSQRTVQRWVTTMSPARRRPGQCGPRLLARPVVGENVVPIWPNSS